MATVKFSQELRDRIAGAATARFSGPLQKAKESSPKDWGDRLYGIIFAAYIPHFALLPKQFFSRKEHIHIHSFDNDGPMVNLAWPLHKKAVFPVDDTWPTEMLARKRGSYGDGLILKHDAQFDEFKAEITEWLKRVNFVAKQQEEFVASVKQVTNAYVTLAPALKAWPPLWDLIPEDVKEKHKKIVERERKEVDLGVDLDRMTALASFSKIRGE